MAQCDDKSCPVHGDIKIRGNVVTGKVVSTKALKTAVIERLILQRVPKYERYMKKKSRISVHNPPCMNAKVGDIAEAGECRKISKTKAFVITKIVNEANSRKQVAESQGVEGKASSRKQIGKKQGVDGEASFGQALHKAKVGGEASFGQALHKAKVGEEK